MNRIDGKSLDITENLLRKLKCECPEMFIDGKVDFDKLKLILGEDIEISDEKYEFKWNGKNDAIKIAQTPSMGTLRPDKESSKNWDNTENLYIEGDNLEVLKLLQKSYFGKIKMIYIDPPYNTGKDFVYKDNFKDNISNYKEVTNQKNKVNVETNGRYHTDWLNMMYPRLKLARNLLKDDGFIFISIDDNEVANLKKLCDEIFGDDNFRNMLMLRRYDKNINTQFIDKGLKSLNVGVEYLLIYSKNTESKFNPVFRDASEERQSQGYWKSFWNDADRPTMRYDILGAKPESGQWKWKKETAYEAVSNYKDYIENYAEKMTLEEYWINTNKEKKFIRRREGLNGKNKGVEHWVAPSTGILRTSNWADLLISESINKLDLKFDSPKNPKVITELTKMACSEDSIILDFFSGSASTAHSVMQLNAESSSNHKFIMVQLPQIVNEKNDAYKDGYLNICEIGKERIRRAGDKVISESGKADLDIGFRVFKLDDSNIKTWDSNYNNLESTLFDMTDNIKEDRSQEDLLYEILLKLGYSLTSKIDEININDKTIFNIENSLLVCLENNIDSEILEHITKMDINKDELKVIFRDSGFKLDKDKMNAVENLKQFDIKNINFI